MTTRTDHLTRDNAALRHLASAYAMLAAATCRAEVVAAHSAIRVAAEAARDSGCKWSEIGDILGIARGNAYQRYRRRVLTTPRSDAPPL